MTEAAMPAYHPPSGSSTCRFCRAPITHWAGAAWLDQSNSARCNNPTGEHMPTPTFAPDHRTERKRRVFLWVFLALQAFFLWVVIVAIQAVAQSTEENCYLSAEDCGAVGGMVGMGTVGVLLFFWVAIDFIVLAVWWVAKRRR